MMSKRLPYAGTKVDPEDTKANINKLLKAHGIQDVQWTTLRGEESLRFIFRTEAKDVGFEIRRPTILAKKRTWNVKRGKYEAVQVPMLAQAWRLVYWYLDLKLKAIEYGLASVEREFLNQMLVGPRTVGDIIEERLSQDQELFKLEDKTEEEPRKVIEAQYQITEEKKEVKEP